MYPPDQRPHIAIVCDTVPYPTRSGDNQRIAELIRILRERGWFVHFVMTGYLDRVVREACLRHVDALHTHSGEGWWARVRYGLRRCVRIVDRLGKHIGVPPVEEIASRMLGRSVTPIVLDYWKRYPQGLDDFVVELASRYPLNAVIVEYIWLYPATQKLNHGVLRLLDTQDIQHKRVEEFASRGHVFPLSITRDEEARIFNKFDAVIAIQAAEAAEIRLMCPQLRALTVGSTGSKLVDHAESVFEGRILYVGGFNAANIDGLRHFLTNVWPGILQGYTQAHLHVCGYVYRGFLGEEYEQVKFRGHLEDIEREYAEAAVVINPSWIGTGLKIKTVEALARGKPLVTTKKGIEGMDRDVEKSTFVCDDAVEFADAVTRLLQDAHVRNNLSQAAKQFAIRHLNAGAVYGELLTYLDEQRRDLSNNHSHGRKTPPVLESTR